MGRIMSLPLLSIPVLNRYDLLERMIDSIDYPIDEILIINNGKEKYIPKNESFNFRVLNLPSNLGCAGSWNLTVKLYPHLSYWSFASADIIWIPGSIEKMVQESGKDFLCLSNQYTSAFSWGENLVRNVGLFDENYYPIYVEYRDYRERIYSKGLKDSIKFNAFEIDGTDDGTTVKSDNLFIKKNTYTEEKNEEYFANKKIQNKWVDTPWNIDRRRDQEWEK
jgi:hypothetical protein